MSLRARQTSRNKTTCHRSPRRKKKCHLFFFLMIILFLSYRFTKTRKPSTSADTAIEFKSTAVLPYVKGLSEQLRRCLRQQDIRPVFKSESTVRSHLVRSPVNAVKFTSAKLEELCKTKLRSMTETSDSPVPRPPPLQRRPQHWTSPVK